MAKTRLDRWTTPERILTILGMDEEADPELQEETAEFFKKRRATLAPDKNAPQFSEFEFVKASKELIFDVEDGLSAFHFVMYSFDTSRCVVDHEKVRVSELGAGAGSEIFGSGVLTAMCREGSDFSLQVTGVPLGKRSLEQLLNDGEKVAERTNRGEGMGVLGTQHTTCGCQQKGILYGGERDIAVVELPGQSAVGWSRSGRCGGQLQVGGQHGLDVSSPLPQVAQSCWRRSAASCSLSRRR